MATVLQLIDSIFETLRPSEHVDISMGQMRGYVNRAAEIARGSGWFLHMEDDESLSFADNTWAYAVPATFAYVRSLRIEDDTHTTSTWDEHIPWPYWDIRIDGAAPTFYINSLWPLPTSGLSIKVIGQKRPTLYDALTETVDPGMEAFLAARASHYALSFMASGNPTLQQDPLRRDLSRENLAVSEALLARHPQEFRMKPNSRLVLGR